jgi:signal transduction histidine kinase
MQFVHTIDDVVLSKEFSNKNLKLLYEPRDILLKADKSRIAEVISNLLSNATKFTAVGTITISVEKDETKNWVIVSVKDTGEGIDASILPRHKIRIEILSRNRTGLIYS